MQGWCVKTSLVEAKKNDYIRIQNELLDVKNRLFKSTIEEPSQQLLNLLKVISILLVIFIILTIVGIQCRKLFVGRVKFRK